ncbi:MAG: hypothetical protein ACREEB_06070 [Caulobacteraceae bacterium]
MKTVALILATCLLASGAAAQAAPPTPDAALNGQNKTLNEGIAARNKAAQDAYQAQMAQYETDKKASADAYASQMASYNAETAARDQQHAADIAAWRVAVVACHKGDYAKCDKKAKTARR